MGPAWNDRHGHRRQRVRSHLQRERQSRHRPRPRQRLLGAGRSGARRANRWASRCRSMRRICFRTATIRCSNEYRAMLGEAVRSALWPVALCSWGRCLRMCRGGISGWLECGRRWAGPPGRGGTSLLRVIPSAARPPFLTCAKTRPLIPAQRALWFSRRSLRSLARPGSRRSLHWSSTRRSRRVGRPFAEVKEGGREADGGHEAKGLPARLRSQNAAIKNPQSSRVHKVIRPETPRVTLITGSTCSRCARIAAAAWAPLPAGQRIHHGLVFVDHAFHAALDRQRRDDGSDRPASSIAGWFATRPGKAAMVASAVVRRLSSLW